MRRKNMKREERSAQIMRLFDAVQNVELTSHDIAKILDLSPSTYLREILHDLARSGKLKVRRVVHRQLSDGKHYKDLYRHAEAK